jgi:hypothetical protein
VTAAAHAWSNIAAHYQKLAQKRKDEGPSIQLACLVLADYCEALWTGQRGPSLAMVAIAEHLIGEDVDGVVAAELKTMDDVEKEALS